MLELFESRVLELFEFFGLFTFIEAESASKLEYDELLVVPFGVTEPLPPVMLLLREQAFHEQLPLGKERKL